MKALSVKQPFAFQIANGEKTIELRSWQTDYRGKLLICASKSEKDVWVKSSEVGEHRLPAGVMMCVVDLVDIKKCFNTPYYQKASCCDYVEHGIWGWVLENPRDVMLKPVNGRLRLFDVDDNLIEFMSDDDDWFAHADKLIDQSKGIGSASLILNYD